MLRNVFWLVLVLPLKIFAFLVNFWAPGKWWVEKIRDAWTAGPLTEKRILIGISFVGGMVFFVAFGLTGISLGLRATFAITMSYLIPLGILGYVTAEREMRVGYRQ